MFKSIHLFCFQAIALEIENISVESDVGNT